MREHCDPASASGRTVAAQKSATRVVANNGDNVVSVSPVEFITLLIAAMGFPVALTIAVCQMINLSRPK